MINSKKKYKIFKNNIDSDDPDNTIFNDSTMSVKKNNNDNFEEISLYNKIIKNNINIIEDQKDNESPTEESKISLSVLDENNIKNIDQLNNNALSLIYNNNNNYKEKNDSNTDSNTDNNSTEDKKELKDKNIENDFICSNNEDTCLLNNNTKIENSKIIYNIKDQEYLNESNYNKNNKENLKIIYNKNNYTNISDKHFHIYKNSQLNPIHSNHTIYLQSNNNNNNNCYDNKLNIYYSLVKNNISNNTYKTNCICHKFDMKILKEIYENATIISFNKSYLLNNIINRNDSKINKNDLILKDSYMHGFKISSLNPNPNYKPNLNIDVGFKINYFNINYINLIIDDDYLVYNKKLNLKIGSLSDSLKINKNLVIFGKTGIVYALINISKGKYFIIGKEELEKRKQNIFLDRNNTEIFSVQNFSPISPRFLKNIKPSIHFD